MEDAIVVTTAPKEVESGTKSRMAKLSARSYNFIKRAVEKTKNKLSEEYAEKYNNVMNQYQHVVESNAGLTNYQQDKLINAVDSLRKTGVKLYAFNEIVNGSRVLNLAGNKIKAIKMPNISKICSIIKERNNISKGYKEAMDYGRNEEYNALNDLVGSINSDILGNAPTATEVAQPSSVAPTEPPKVEEVKPSTNFDALFANASVKSQVNPVETPVVTPPSVPPVTPQVNFFGTAPVDTVPTFVPNTNSQDTEVQEVNSETENLKRENNALKAENDALHKKIQEFQQTIIKLQNQLRAKDIAIGKLLTEQYGPVTTSQERTL